jgi:uncharacterized membrane protein
LPIRSRIILAFAAAVFGLGVTAQPARAQAQPASPAKKLPAGPPAPQSTHYPILLLAFGNDPSWSLRIGLKGPERLDRPKYPPIVLEPAEVTHESGADAWTYHAKDSATGASVVLHLTREACADPVTDPTAAPRPASGKYTFRASVDHTQLPSMKGCARIATELFPKINNQPDDADDTAKNKPPAPTITNFKPPVAVAYLNAAGAVVLNRGTVRKTVAPSGTELALSHDGKKLLYTRSDSKTGPDRTIVLYDFDTGKSQDLVHGYVRQAFWSPDDSRIAFLKAQDRAWQAWSFAVAAPDSATLFSSQSVNSLHGWMDGHTLLTSDMQIAYWLSDEQPMQTMPLTDIYGPAFQVMSSDAIRVHPLNPDLILVSADYASAPAGAPKDAMGLTAGFFLYEVRSRRRTVLCPPDQWGRAAEWSRDGLQIFYTRVVTGTTSTFRIFWDGTGTQKYSSASWLVIGQ